MTERLVHVLRHGETVGGARYCGTTDVPLSVKGWRQMDGATGSLTWDRIITSPLRRCRAFAQAVSRRSDAPLTVDGRLGEMDFGLWEGRRAEEILAQDPEPLARFWRDPLSHPPPGGERLEDVAARVLDAWEDIRSPDRGKRILVVTHGGPIRIILCHVHGLPIERSLGLEVEHASLRVLSIDRHRRATQLPERSA